MTTNNNNNNNNNNNKIIKLNICGTLLEISKDILIKSLYFKSMLDGNFQEAHTDKAIFINEEFGAFKHIIRLLINPQYSFPIKFNYLKDVYLIPELENEEEEDDEPELEIKNKSTDQIKAAHYDTLIMLGANKYIGKIYQKIFNLKDTSAGNINIQSSYTEKNKLVFEFSRIFDAIKKIRIVYQNVKINFNVKYELTQNNGILLNIDNKYCEALDLLNDDKLNESVYDPKNKTIIHEIPIYSESLMIDYYYKTALSINCDDWKNYFDSCYVEYYGMYYHLEDREKIYKKSERIFYQIKFTLETDLQNIRIKKRGICKNMILIIKSDDNKNMKFNNIKFFVGYYTIKTISNKEAKNFLQINNLNTKHHVYLIDFDTGLNINIIDKITIEMPNENKKYQAYIWYHMFNIIAIQDGSMCLTFSC